jgi:serine protease
LYAASSGISPAVGQWYLRAPDATLVSAINAEAAWAITTGSPNIVVADLDTGVLFDHPDLANKLYPGYDFITTLSIAGDGGGIDNNAADPGDYTTRGQCGRGVAATSSSWHGTQTAGLIGAQSDNGQGMASVGYNVMLLPVRVLGRCGGNDSDIIAGMLWAGGVSSYPTANPHPARVINMSLGGSGSCSVAYADAIQRLAAAGVTVVVAAGNDEGLALGSPASCSGVIAVAGVRHLGTKVGFSSVGAGVTIAAPGGNCVNDSGPCLYPILTTTNTGTAGPATNTYSDSTNISVGTSFAAPLVAGTVALMLSANPELKPAEITGLIKATARPFPATSADATVPQCHAPNGVAQDECLCTTSTCGAGLLDAGAAVAAAAAASASSDVQRVFNWAEAAYPQYFPKPGIAGSWQQYSYRYYPATGNYLGAAGGRIVVHNGRDWVLLDVGPVAGFLAQAVQAGY